MIHLKTGPGRLGVDQERTDQTGKHDHSRPLRRQLTCRRMLPLAGFEGQQSGVQCKAVRD